jgi:hypothetical protein
MIWRKLTRWLFYLSCWCWKHVPQPKIEVSPQTLDRLERSKKQARELSCRDRISKGECIK